MKEKIKESIGISLKKKSVSCVVDFIYTKKEDMMKNLRTIMIGINLHNMPAGVISNDT